MTAATHHAHRGFARDVPPAVDDGEPSLSWGVILSYLKPFPGRMSNAARITAASLLVVVIAETFRLPETAVIAYLPLAFYKDDANATTLMAPFAGLAVIASLGVSLLIFMVLLAEPALRLPLIGFFVFVSMFLSRATSAGQMFFLFALMVFYTQHLGDDVLSNALSGSVYSNNTSYQLPALAFMPPEEALVHTMLYLALAFLLPTIAIYGVNRLTMGDPIVKLRDAMAERFAAVADFCEDPEASRERIVALAEQGTAKLRGQNDVAGKLANRRYDPEVGRAVIDRLSRVMLALLAWTKIDDDRQASAKDLRSLAEPFRKIEHAIRRNGHFDVPPASENRPATPLLAPESVAAPLVVELRRALVVIERVLSKSAASGGEAAAAAEKGKFLKPDAFTNPLYAQFALKLTLAVCVVYLFIQFADWSKIGTAIATVFLVGLDSVGQSTQKARLRIFGSGVGGALGFVAIFLLMPVTTDIGQLLLMLAPVIFLGSWIRVGSERIAYFGQQIAFAFLLTTLQDYGPTLDFQTARDRMVGIFVGELVVLTIFSSLWPVKVADVVRKNVGDAFDQLAKLVSPVDRDGGEAGEARRSAVARRFGASIAAARAALPDKKLEPRELNQPVEHPRLKSRPIDNDMLDRIQSLVVPTIVVARGNADRDDSHFGPAADEALLKHGRAMSEWFARCARWTRTGEGAEELREALPSLHEPTPEAGEPGSDATARWFVILQHEVGDVLAEIGPASGREVDASKEQRSSSW